MQTQNPTPTIDTGRDHLGGAATGPDHSAPAAGGAAERTRPSGAGAIGLVTAAAIGGALSLALGVYANVHTPTFQGIETFGFPAVLPMKAWFTTAAAFLAIAQLTSAAWMWQRLPGAGRAPTWVGPAHRWLGTAAFVLTLPVAYHCLWALGFQSTDTRVLVHSLLGCLFYGVFTTKMLVLRSKRVGPHTLPTVGGLLVVVLVAIWLTSSWWFFTTFGFPGV